MDRPNPPFTPLVQSVFKRLHAHPEVCALRFRGVSVSNGALLRAALALADSLQGAGIGPGTLAGVCLQRTPDVLALLLALWWKGATYVPLDPALPRERLFAMCEAAGLEFVITREGLGNNVERLPCSLLLLDEVMLDPSAEPEAILPHSAHTADANDLAYILFTSGTTGTPKGVKISQGNIAALFSAVVPLLELPPGSRFLGCASFSFDIAFFELLAPLLCGSTLVLADDATCSSPLQLLALLEHERVNIVQATPSHWQLLNAAAWSYPITIAIATGEPLLRDTAAAILRRAGTLWNLYGPTECTIWSSAYRVCTADLGTTAPPVISIGTPLPGCTLQLERHPDVDDEYETGELVIGGVGVSPGYCATLDSGSGFRTATSKERRYHSGDLCRRDTEGLFHYLRRVDNQVKHNGYRIEPEEIALVLRQHMSINQAACLVRPASADAPSLLFACVTLRPGMPNRNKTTLNEYLADYLPTWMLPQRYFFLDQLPLNGNGKLDRAALMTLTTAIPEQGTGIESQVAAVFCEVLDIETIGPCDSFLDVGGTSMLAATLVLTLNERLGSQLSLRQTLATPPTVSSVIQHLRAAAVANPMT